METYIEETNLCIVPRRILAPEAARLIRLGSRLGIMYDSSERSPLVQLTARQSPQLVKDIDHLGIRLLLPPVRELLVVQ